MAQTNLTDVSVRSLRPPLKGQKIYFDSAVPGFGIRVSYAGTKSWIVVVGVQRRYITLARYPAVTLKEARVAAKQALSAPPDLTRSVSLKEAIDMYLKHCQARCRVRTIKTYSYTLNTHFKEQAMRLRSLTTERFMEIVDALGNTPSEQLHFFLVSKAFFRFCVMRKLLMRSPIESIPAPAKRAIRERILSHEELQAVWLVADSDTATLSRIIQICILTGQRRGEMSKLRWEYIDQDKRLINLPSFITKNGRPHTFPYGPMLEAVLKKIPNSGSKLFPGRTEKNEFFEGWSRGKENFDLLCPLKEQWQLHDLRRVFYSNMAALAVAPHVCAKLVNHVTGIAAISGISAVYNKHLYVSEMRAAIELWEARLQMVVGGNIEINRLAA